MEDRPVLITREGQRIGERFTVDKDIYVVGRGSECDLVLPERQVSREHIRILNENGRYLLHDLGSKNGTHLNGDKVSGTVPLKDGDEIQIALAVKLVFVGTDATLPLNFDIPTRKKSLVIDDAQRSVTIHGESVSPPLSLAQFRLLELLYKADGAVCGRDQIVDVVWPGTDGLGVSEQAIDALVRRLRDRLAEVTEHDYVVTVRGHGFRLDNPLITNDI